MDALSAVDAFDITVTFIHKGGDFELRAAIHIVYGGDSLNFVTNTVDGFLLAASEPSAVGKTINLGSGREISIGDLAGLIAQMTGRSIQIESEEQRLRPQDSEVERLLADNTLAQKILGWQPKVNLEEGLARTIAWIKDNLELYRNAYAY